MASEHKTIGTKESEYFALLAWKKGKVYKSVLFLKGEVGKAIINTKGKTVLHFFSVCNIYTSVN